MNVTYISHCKRKSYEPVVKSGLSVTPSQMSEMTAKGIPISSQLSALEYDSTDVGLGDFNIPVDMRRGVDIADTWNAQKDAREHMLDARKKGVVVEPKIE